MTDEKYMGMAIDESLKGDYPFGAIITKDNSVIARAHNTANSDPTAHAEMNAIRFACGNLKTNNLTGCILYATCEPCPMCFTAAWWARITKIIYGAEGDDVQDETWKIDLKSTELNKRSGDKISIEGGVLSEQCCRLFNPNRVDEV